MRELRPRPFPSLNEEGPGSADQRAEREGRQPMPSQTIRPRALRPAPHRQFLPLVSRPSAGIRLGLYEGEPENCRRDLRQFLPVLFHLMLTLCAFKVFHLEGRAFQGLAVLATLALPVHYALPYHWKKPAFVGLSVVGLAWALGSGVAAVVLPASALLIGACLLPIAWSARAGIVAVFALALGVARAVVPVAGAAEAALAVLGSMFMFRMILFLYELKHSEVPENPLDAVAYFFLLPNFCFLLFPVVDYRAFRRGYFAADVHDIQRDGLRLMTRGLVHLLAYRLVYHELTISPEEVRGLGTLAGHVVTNYLKYLHVSGQFHMAAGLLHLFGFRLPETHHNYLLATGFTDYWRRINIPWKDFMVRVVFNPVAFRLKRRPQWQSLTLATTAVFVATWLLHAYQAFWLRGSWGFSVPDALFWGILGALVLVNVQLDVRRSSARPEVGGRARALAIRILKTAATFTTVALLWSLWTSPSLPAWLAMMGRGLRVGP